MANQADVDPAQAPVSTPERDKVAEVRAHILNEFERYGDVVVQTAASDIPGLLRLLKHERRAEIMDAARGRLVEIVDRGGVIDFRVQKVIRADFELSAAEFGEITALLVNTGIITAVPGEGYRKAFSAEEKEFDRTATPEDRALRGFQKEGEQADLAKKLVMKEIKGRYGITHSDFLKHMEREYPDINETLVLYAIDGLRGRKFGIDEQDRIIEFKGWA